MRMGAMVRIARTPCSDATISDIARTGLRSIGIAMIAAGSEQASGQMGRWTDVPVGEICHRVVRRAYACQEGWSCATKHPRTRR